MQVLQVSALRCTPSHVHCKCSFVYTCVWPRYAHDLAPQTPLPPPPQPCTPKTHEPPPRPAPPPAPEGGPPFDINIKLSQFLSTLSSEHGKTALDKTDKWRLYNYKKASQKVRDYHLPLDHGNEAALEDFSKFGTKTMLKIREFLATGGSERL